jgi:hypothetical protein
MKSKKYNPDFSLNSSATSALELNISFSSSDLVAMRETFILVGLPQIDDSFH